MAWQWTDDTLVDYVNWIEPEPIVEEGEITEDTVEDPGEAAETTEGDESTRRRQLLDDAEETIEEDPN